MALDPAAVFALNEIEKRVGKDYRNRISGISGLAMLTSLFDLELEIGKTLPDAIKADIIEKLDATGKLFCKVAAETFNQSPVDVLKDLRSITTPIQNSIFK